MALLTILAAMMCWSCKDDKDELKYPLTIGDRLYFNPEESIAYNPIALEELPEFVQEELSKSTLRIYDYVYSGFWEERRAYLVITSEVIFIQCSDGGYFYVEDGTSFGLLSYDELSQKQIDLDNWVCIYFWKNANL